MKTFITSIKKPNINQLAVAAAIIGGTTVAAGSIAFAHQGADNKTKPVQVAHIENDSDDNSAPTATLAVETTAPTTTDNSTNTPTDTSTDPAPANPNDPAVSLGDARAIADKELPGKTFKEAEFEFEDGVWVWEIKFSDGSQVVINSESGDVIGTRTGKDMPKNSNKDHHKNGDKDDDHDNGRRGRN